MRIPAFLRPAILVFAAACAESRAGVPDGIPQKPEGILFAVSPVYEGHVSLDPIAIITPNGLRDPWEIESDSQYRAQFLKPGTHYPIRQLGVEIKWATVAQQVDPGCTARTGLAAAMPPTRKDEDWRALASDVFGPAARQALMRPAFSVEQWELRALADSVHLANDVDRQALQRTESRTNWAIPMAGMDEPVLAGSFDITFPNGDSTHTTYTQFLMAEKRGGRWMPVHVFHERDDGQVGRRSLLDLMDVDEDGIPELITQAMYAEGWGYTVLKRGREGWTEIYRGGGGSC